MRSTTSSVGCSTGSAPSSPRPRWPRCGATHGSRPSCPTAGSTRPATSSHRPGAWTGSTRGRCRSTGDTGTSRPALGVTAFVIDTGIRASHDEFGGRVSSGWDFVDKDANATDCAGHGTHVAGTIGGRTYGVAKGVALVSLRVLNCRGMGNTTNVIAALDWAVQHKPATPSVINLSLGGDADPALDAAVEATVSAGIPVVVAAGNGDEFGIGIDACLDSPARASVGDHRRRLRPSDRRSLLLQLRPLRGPVRSRARTSCRPTSIPTPRRWLRAGRRWRPRMWPASSPDLQGRQPVSRRSRGCSPRATVGKIVDRG